MKTALIFGLAMSLAVSGLAQAEPKKTICRAGTEGATAGVLADASTGALVLDSKRKPIPCDLPQAVNGAEGAVGSATGLSTTGGVALAGAIAGGVVAGTSGNGGRGNNGGCKLVPISGGAVCM